MLVHYTCMNADGNVLETTLEGKPVEVIEGNQDVLPELERHFLSMKPGECRKVVLKPSQTFGQIMEDLFFEVPMEMLQLDCEPEVGMVVELAQDDEEPYPGTIVEIYEDCVLVDCNHPLAGQTLTFELQRIE